MTPYYQKLKAEHEERNRAHRIAVGKICRCGDCLCCKAYAESGDFVKQSTKAPEKCARG